MRLTKLRALAAITVVMAAVLAEPVGAHVHAVAADAPPAFTLGGDVRTPLTISLDELAALPLSSYSRACGPGLLQRYIGIDVLGLVEAAGPLTNDPAGFSVQISGAGGQSVTLPASALDPQASPDHPLGPLLAIDDPNGPLTADQGPFFLESGSCDTSKDVAAVQSITVTVTNPQTSAAVSVDDPEALLESALQPADLPDLLPRYVATRVTLLPQPEEVTLRYFGYWNADDAEVDEAVSVYPDVSVAAMQLGQVHGVTFDQDSPCNDQPQQTLPPLGLGDEDIAFAFSCPADADVASDAGDTLTAVDFFRIGRVVGEISVTRPAPGDPSALMGEAAAIVAGRLATLQQ